MRVVLYIRCSTAAQSVDMQRKDLRQYAKQRGFTIVQEYSDEGVSGSKDSRPALNRLMKAARRRVFDAVLVWRFDRFGRSLRHLLNTLEEFEHLGIGFLSYQENIDTTSPTGRVLFSIIGAFGQFEREIIKQRVRAGLMNAVKAGKRLGRPKQRDDQKIFLLRSQGLSIRQIASELSISKGSVQKSLSVLKTFGNSVGKPQ